MAGKRPGVYLGKEPFIFISYSHKDTDRVMPMIEGLQRRGIRVWYDEGLEVGSHWDEKISQRLMDCTYLVCFITKNFLESENCLNEIHMAAEEKKGPLITFLDRVELPPAMKLQYGRLHALSLPQHESRESFVDHIAMTEALRPCCADISKLPGQKQSQSAAAPRPAPEKPVPSKPVASKPVASNKRSSSGMGKWIAIGAAVVALVVALVLVLPRLGNDIPDDPNSGTPGGSSTGDPLPSDPSDRYELAMTYIREGKYYDAYVIFQELGDYSDSASQMASIRESAFLQQIRQAQPGDIVYWGSYEQDAITSNGKEDIAWIVLYDDSGRKLLLSQSCLDCQPYNEQNAPTNWAKCTLRTWLNDDFYWEAFNDKEQECLYLPVIRTENSEDSRDYVFLLSMAEANLYLDLFENGLFTEYAIRQGAGKDLQHWWLRDTHNGAYNFGATSYKGKVIADLGAQVHYDGVAVRPCIWVDTRTEAQREEEYQSAVNLFEKANYKKALPAFEALGNYKDSQDYCKRLPKLILMKPYMEAEVGDEVRLGNYDWIVVEKQDDKILVVSKYSVGSVGYRDSGMYYTWDVSDLRTWLNGYFITNMLMPGDEKALILPTKVSTPVNPEYGTDGGPDVTDQLFVLSYEEVIKYFPNAQNRVLTTLEDTATGVAWWTRTMGQNQDNVVCVDQYGEIHLEGNVSHDFVYKAHARPAMWISTAE